MFVWTKISFELGKNGGHMPSSLDSKSIVVVRQEGKLYYILAIYKVLQFSNFNSRVCLGCLNGCIMHMALYQ